jgi:hypothetical protein
VVVAERAAQPFNVALHDRRGHLVGYEGDASQTADILLENLAAKASGALALYHLLHQNGTPPSTSMTFSAAAAR